MLHAATIPAIIGGGNTLVFTNLKTAKKLFYLASNTAAVAIDCTSFQPNVFNA